MSEYSPEYLSDALLFIILTEIVETCAGFYVEEIEDKLVDNKVVI